MLKIILFTIYVSAVYSSDCELSQWTEWSPCYGTCYFGQIVRNRDVVRPSLPDRPGAPTKRCPHLYETSFCTPTSCKVTSEIVDLPSESSRQRLPVKLVLDKDLTEKGRIDSKAKLVAVVREGVRLKENTIEAKVLSTTPNDKPEIPTEATPVIEKLQYGNEDEDEANSFRGEIIAEGRTALKVNDSDRETMFTSDESLHAAGIDLPKHLKPAKERKRVEKQRLKFSEHEEDLSVSPISDVLRELESAANFRTPMDEKHIRSVLRKNRKLMRALVEAYKLRTTTIASTSTAVTLPQEESTDSTTASPTTNESVQEQDSKVLITTELSSQEIVEPQQEAEAATLSSTTELTSSVDENASLSELSSYATETTSEVASSSESIAFATEPADESGFESITSSEDFQTDNDVSNSTESSLESESSSELPSSTLESTDLIEAMNMTEDTPITATVVPENEIPDITKAAEVQSMMNISDAELESTTIMNPSAVTVDEVLDTSSTTLTDTDTATTTAATTTTTMATTTTTTSPPYWPKKGYVPNTRKHASEITSKLYMTQEIVQALSDEPIRRSPILRLDCLESRRCCKITRTECSDGSVPKYVKRFYRPRGSDICIPYHYPRCSQSEEMEEQPIQFEQNCQDICFRGPEKRISPLLTLGDSQ